MQLQRNERIDTLYSGIKLSVIKTTNSIGAWSRDAGAGLGPCSVGVPQIGSKIHLRRGEGCVCVCVCVGGGGGGGSWS